MWNFGATNQLYDGASIHPLSVGLHAHVHAECSALQGSPSSLQLDIFSGTSL